MNSPSNLRAILAMVVAMGMFVSSDSCMKLALEKAPLGQLMLMRGIASVLICLGLIVALGQAASAEGHVQPLAGGPRPLGDRRQCQLHAWGLGFIAIADLVAIAQTAPLFVLLGAWAFRGEKPGGIRMSLILVGLGGRTPGGPARRRARVLLRHAGLPLPHGRRHARPASRPRAPRDVPPLVATLTLLLILGARRASIGTLAFETPRHARRGGNSSDAHGGRPAGRRALPALCRPTAWRRRAPSPPSCTRSPSGPCSPSVVLFGDIPERPRHRRHGAGGARRPRHHLARWPPAPRGMQAPRGRDAGGLKAEFSAQIIPSACSLPERKGGDRVIGLQRDRAAVNASRAIGVHLRHQLVDRGEALVGADQVDEFHQHLAAIEIAVEADEMDLEEGAAGVEGRAGRRNSRPPASDVPPSEPHRAPGPHRCRETGPHPCRARC